MINFKPFYGTVTAITDFPIGVNDESTGCYKLLSVVNANGDLVNFVVSPHTYFVEGSIVTTNDRIVAYYDGNVPVPLIYPPQYHALIIVKITQRYNVKVDYFDDQLLSMDGQLKLNISLNTQILLTNGQPFLKSPVKRNLIVIYGPSTRSIPAQTTPYKIIVWCT